jgi:hypothetical protein
MNLKIQPLQREPVREKLVLEVPRFSPGPFALPKEAWEPLFPVKDFEGDFPVFWEESDLRVLIGDENRFRSESGPYWVERCWFLPGAIVRDPAGCLYGMIRKAIPAADTRATSSAFEFGPETWAKLREEMKDGELMLGWVHSHSVQFLRGEEEESPGERPPRRDGAGRAGEKEEKESGLFLSGMDTDSALKRGFNAPYHLTVILDSDVCLRPPHHIPLEEAVGVWGWFQGRLCRRSIYVIKEKRR